MLKRILKKIASAIIKTKTVNYQGFEIQGAFEDYGLLKALENDRREPLMAELFCSKINPGMTVVDIGAHLGQYTLLAARKVGSTGRVLAFEPHPRSFDYLRGNIARNGYNETVTALPIAVSNQNGEAVLHADLLQSDFTSLLGRRDPADTQEVKVKTAVLDAIDGQMNPDVVKIDVEGAEILVLDGIAQTLHRSRTAGRSPTLFIESNPEALAQAGSSPRALRDRLERLGFRSILAILEERRSLEPFSDRHFDVCLNLICDESVEPGAHLDP